MAVDLGTGSESHDIEIELQEHEQAPPLSVELSPSEKALLKLGEWLRHWSKGEVEDDIVVSARYVPDRILADALPDGAMQSLTAQPGELEYSLRMVVGPDRGQTLALTARPGPAAPFFDILVASYPDRLVLASPQAAEANRLVPNRGRRLPLSLLHAPNCSKEGTPQFDLWLGRHPDVATTQLRNATAFDLDVLLSPAYMLGNLPKDQTTCILSEGILTIGDALSALQVEAATGRLVEYRFADRNGAVSFSIRSEKQALAAEFRTIERTLATATAGYDSDSPWKSAAEFLVDFGFHFRAREQVGSFGSRRIVRRVAKTDPSLDAA